MFAANNLLAERAWRLIRERGLRLPEDVSLVGFDDVPWMEMVSPGITVVAQPTEELGRRAAQLLLRRIADPGCAHAVEQLQPTLVVRGSTGRRFTRSGRWGSPGADFLTHPGEVCLRSHVPNACTCRGSR